MNDAPRIVLASASPRRRELLSQIGIEYTTIAADVDETRKQNESPIDHVVRVARMKADAVAPRVPDAVVVAADTEVVIDGEVLGKPTGAADAEAMLRRLSGRTHSVISVVVVRYQGRTLERVVPTEITMRALADAEIAAYIATGESFDKAGGYAIQGRAGAFVSHIEGSYSGTVGLPLYETLALIDEVRR